MPRIATSLIKQAKRIHPFLHLLLRPCRDLESARNELRWLDQYQRQLVAAPTHLPRKHHHGRNKARPVRTLSLHELCLERGRGRPLQYILGTQPFGNLEIMCRKGVLIPRYDSQYKLCQLFVLYRGYISVYVPNIKNHRSQTEGYTMRLSALLIPPRTCKGRQSPKTKPILRILDLGTGSGCILLLLIERLHRYYDFEAVGLDTSPTAIRLAQQNLQHNINIGNLPVSIKAMVRFQLCDMTDHRAVSEIMPSAHIVVSNPPYIPLAELRSHTERSVRVYEPRQALVAEPLAGSGLTAFEEALLEYCARGRVWACLVEFVDERRAQNFARRAIERKASSRASLDCRSEIWREEERGIVSEPRGDDGDATASAQRSAGQDSVEEHPRVVDRDNGAVQAVVAVSGQWHDWFGGEI